ASIMLNGQSQSESVWDAGPTGRVEASLDVLSSNKTHLTVNITQPIQVGLNDTYDDGDQSRSHFALNVATTTGLLDFTADGADKTISGSIDSGPIRFDFPFNAYTYLLDRPAAPSVQHSESVSVQIPAVTGDFSYRPDGDALDVSRLGLGATS